MKKLNSVNIRNTGRYFLRYVLMGIAACVAAPVLFRLFGVEVAFAGGTEAAGSAINAIILVAKIICIVVGAIFVLMGIIKYAIAHANDNGPDMTRAATMLASGVVLILLGTIVIDILNLSELITNAASEISG